MEWRKARMAYRAILTKSDTVFAGEEEVFIAVGSSEDPMELARRISELGPWQDIVKLGRRPYFFTRGITGFLQEISTSRPGR